MTRTPIEQRCVEIADRVVPAYRDGRRSYSCTSWTARRWEAAYQAAKVTMTSAVWLPIDLAPRDGTPIIGAYFNSPWAESHLNGTIARVWFQPEFDAFISSAREMQMHNGYTFVDGSTRKLHSPAIERVTHYIPMPVAKPD